MDGLKLNLANPDLVPAAGASCLLPWLRRIPAEGWVPARRLPVAFGLLLAFEILALLLFIAVSHHWVGPLNKPTTTDFASFYAAGSLTDAGHPALAYDLAAHRAAEEQATEPGIKYQYFYYPPVFLFICAALAKLPYLPGFIVFQALTLPLYLFVGRRTLDDTRWSALLGLLAFPAVFWNIGLGQNAFLTAALFGGGLLLIDRRPVLAGILFGALCYKPHFGLLIPVALAAGGRWRAFVAAGISAATLILLSVAAFGWQSWQDYLAVCRFAGDLQLGLYRPRGVRHALWRGAADRRRRGRRLCGCKPWRASSRSASSPSSGARISACRCAPPRSLPRRSSLCRWP